jgi:hypothetical protein
MNSSQERSPLNGQSFDCPYYFSTIPELVDSATNLHPAAAQELVASLLERERLVLLDLLKTWWSYPLFVVLKE